MRPALRINFQGHDCEDFLLFSAMASTSFSDIMLKDSIGRGTSAQATTTDNRSKFANDFLSLGRGT